MNAPAAPARDRFPLLVGAAVVLVLLVVGVAALRSWQDLAAQRAREAAVEADIARTETDVRRLEQRIRRLKEDPFTLERLARHELGLVRPEDLVMVFPVRGAAPAALPPVMAPVVEPAAEAAATADASVPPPSPDGAAAGSATLPD